MTFARGLFNQCLLTLFSVEHAEQRVCFQRLWPEDVPRVICFFIKTLRRVPVENRATKRNMVGRIENLGGTLVFDSGLGNGTTITIDIPIKE